MDVSEVSVSQVSRAVVITNQQLRILLFIYRFRFVSTAQLQFVLGKKQVQQVQQRLNLLVARGWIGRNFSKLDRLTGKYASYYLLPKGMMCSSNKRLGQATSLINEQRIISIRIRPLPSALLATV